MKTYPSETQNGGTTIVLDCLDEAIQIGRDCLARILSNQRKLDPRTQIKLRTIGRDQPGETITTTVGERLVSLESRAEDFEKCIQAILTGDASANSLILEKADRLTDLVKAIEPTMAGNYRGFERAEDGVAVDAGLLACGDERPFFRRRVTDEVGAQAGRGRCYRVLLNTDLTWFGTAEDNAAIVGALVLSLQDFGPVELWVQQGWLGGCPDEDGVTLFKLDCGQAFEPTQLAFWCGHPMKDQSFSRDVNMALGRRSGGTSKFAEIPADLFLRGDWMKLYGVKDDFDTLLHTEQFDIMAKWIAETAMRIIKHDEQGGDTHGLAG